jgi:hypothetical protein
MGLGLACFDDPSSSESGGCEDGMENCGCFENNTCLGTLECINGLCLAGNGETGGDGDGDGDGDSGDGDGDGGDGDGDGDGDGGDGDGDGDPTFCDQQGANVLLCYDFDGVDPLAGLIPLQRQNGMLGVSEAQSVSPPRSLEVIAVGDDMQGADVSISTTLGGAAVPFDGELSTKIWLDASCLTDSERSLVAMQFLDNSNPDAPFKLNLTLWATATYVKLYVSDAGQGFPSVPYQLDVPLPTQAWTDVRIRFAANQSVVTVTLGGIEHPVPVAEVTQELIQEIAAITPTVSIGTSTAQGAAGCTMYVDDVIVSEG